MKFTSPKLYIRPSNGLIFGPDASLDVAGSFFASTADEIKIHQCKISANPRPHGAKAPRYIWGKGR